MRSIRSSVNSSTASCAAPSPNASSAISQYESPPRRCRSRTRRPRRCHPRPEAGRGRRSRRCHRVDHRRVGIAEAWSVEVHQCLGELPDVFLGRTIQEESFGDLPERVAIDDLVLVDDAQVLPARPRRGDRRRRTRADTAGAAAPTTELPPPEAEGPSRRRASTGPTTIRRPVDGVVSVQVPDLRPAARVAETRSAVSTDSPRCTAESMRHRRLDERRLLGVIELTVYGRGDANDPADTKLGASDVTAVSPAAIHRLRPANSELRHDRGALPRGFEDGAENGRHQAEPQHPADEQQHAHGDRGDLRWSEITLEERLDLFARADRAPECHDSSPACEQASNNAVRRRARRPSRRGQLEATPRPPLAAPVASMLFESSQTPPHSSWAQRSATTEGGRPSSCGHPSTTVTISYTR